MAQAFYFLISLYVVVQSAEIAVRQATALSRKARLTEYATGFLVVAIISVFPEGFISIMSAFQETPSFGLGTLFGSNVADLTLVFATIVLVSGKSLNIQSTVLQGRTRYLLLLAFPLLLGLDGHYTRLDGSILIIAGIFFFYRVLKPHKPSFRPTVTMTVGEFLRLVLIFLASIVALLASSSFTVKYGVGLAGILGVNPTLVGLLAVAIGTTLPELFFSLKALHANHHSLALGDILGTVITDATIIVGITALIHPFTFHRTLVYSTGTFMVLAAGLLFYLMKSDRKLTRAEAVGLVFFYILFVIVEFSVNTSRSVL